MKRAPVTTGQTWEHRTDGKRFIVASVEPQYTRTRLGVSKAIMVTGQYPDGGRVHTPVGYLRDYFRLVEEG